MVDFSILQTPNYLDLYMKSHEQGRAQARQQGIENVLKSSLTDIAGAEKDLISMGAFDEAQQLRKIRIDQARQKAANAAKALNFDEAASSLAEAGDIAGSEQMAQRGRAASIGQQVASGDVAGARTAALGAGDFDTAAAISKMDDAERARVAERTDTIGSIAQRLRTSVPYAERKAAIQSLVPALLQRGFTQEELDTVLNADPTDANLDAFVASSMSLKEALDASKPALRTVGNGAVVFDDRTGRPVFENPKAFAPPRTSASATQGAVTTSPVLQGIEAELRRRGVLK